MGNLRFYNFGGTRTGAYFAFLHNTLRSPLPIYFLFSCLENIEPTLWALQNFPSLIGGQHVVTAPLSHRILWMRWKPFKTWAAHWKWTPLPSAVLTAGSLVLEETRASKTSLGQGALSQWRTLDAVKDKLKFSTPILWRDSVPPILSTCFTAAHIARKIREKLELDWKLIFHPYFPITLTTPDITYIFRHSPSPPLVT